MKRKKHFSQFMFYIHVCILVKLRQTLQTEGHKGRVSSIIEGGFPLDKNYFLVGINFKCLSFSCTFHQLHSNNLYWIDCFPITHPTRVALMKFFCRHGNINFGWHFCFKQTMIGKRSLWGGHRNLNFNQLTLCFS